MQDQHAHRPHAWAGTAQRASASASPVSLGVGPGSAERRFTPPAGRQGASVDPAILPEPAALQRSADAGQPPWATRSVHVHLGELATSVWVRDARLTPQGALRLLQHLPLAMAGAGASSRVVLSVNGHPVALPVRT